jgi:hypothetical protein
MKLFCDINEEITVLTEEVKPGVKNYFIEGVMLQANIRNRNNREYPMEVLEPEVERYRKTFVEQKRAFGELGHPEGPIINLERVSHMITNLRREGNNFIGRAKIMDTPYGKIVKNLIDEGAKLGVSTRGMGTLEQKGSHSVVKGDFQLSTAADIVADPSAPDAFVRGIMEGKEWVWDNGILKEKKIEEMKRQIAATPSRRLDAAKVEIFEKFIRNLVNDK